MKKSGNRSYCIVVTIAAYDLCVISHSRMTPQYPTMHFCAISDIYGDRSLAYQRGS